MDAALEMRADRDKGSSRASSPAFRSGITCARCGGLMVGEFCIDLPNGTENSSSSHHVVCSAARLLIR